MPVSDDQFRIGVIAGGIALAAVIGTLRFCGSVAPLPAKPAPAYARGTQSQLLTKSAASPNVYLEYLAKDAAAAGVRTPTIDDMSRKLAYRGDDVRHVLELGDPTIEVAGLRITLVRDGNSLVLEIKNTTSVDLAYTVVTQPTPYVGECTSAPALSHNAIVIGKGKTERRTECVFREDMAIAVTRVETVELSAMSAWLLALVPPSSIGLDPRTSRGHRGVVANETCAAVISQAVRSGLEKGEIGWRDLVDFYARHRCSTYRFPLTYRAFKSDSERPLPASAAGM